MVLGGVGRSKIYKETPLDVSIKNLKIRQPHRGVSVSERPRGGGDPDQSQKRIIKNT